jgi:hypothetical protein
MYYYYYCYVNFATCYPIWWDFGTLLWTIKKSDLSTYELGFFYNLITQFVAIGRNFCSISRKNKLWTNNKILRLTSSLPIFYLFNKQGKQLADWEKVYYFSKQNREQTLLKQEISNWWFCFFRYFVIITAVLT